MRAEPITCYRPRPELAKAIAAPPYDVFDRAEATAYVAAHPQSFLAIDRPEATFPPEHDACADDVYARAHDLLAERANAGELLRDGTPCFYLYRQRTADHEQTGIVAAFAIDDYANGVICRHELTRQEKEDDRLRHIEATTCQTGPVFLAYRENPVMEALVEAAKTAEPLYDFRDEERVRHTVWRVARPAAVESIRLMLEHVGRAYIVDGHHRAAAAARFCQRLRTEAGDAHTGNEAYNFFLGALFPASQLACAPYDRVVADSAGLTEDELVRALETAGFAVGERQQEPVAPAERGTFGLFAFGAWRELAFRGDRPDDPAAALDVSLMQERVLGPVLGVSDPREDERLSFVGGGDLAELERRAGETGIAFSLAASSAADLMAVADAGELMPPKSTWFVPKLKSGLFVRRVCLRECLIDGARPRKSEE